MVGTHVLSSKEEFPINSFSQRLQVRVLVRAKEPSSSGWGIRPNLGEVEASIILTPDINGWKLRLSDAVEVDFQVTQSSRALVLNIHTSPSYGISSPVVDQNSAWLVAAIFIAVAWEYKPSAGEVS